MELSKWVYGLNYWDFINPLTGTNGYFMRQLDGDTIHYWWSKSHPNEIDYTQVFIIPQ